MGGALHQKIGFFLGLALFALCLFGLDDPDRPSLGPMAGVAALMSVWWITEAIPIPVTALVPVVLFPLLRICSGREVASEYFNHLVFLFLGGFMIALALEKWNLHRRIALGIVAAIGSRPRRIILGFMAATAFLSMWISNTATAMMMVPIAMSVIAVIPKAAGDDEDGGAHDRFVANFAVTLLLAIAYSASIGGASTLIGTPPNVVLTRVYEMQFPDAEPIGFAQWMGMALPLTGVFLVVVWFFLTYIIYPTGHSPLFAGREVIESERAKLGPITPPEARVLIVFVLTVFLWIFRRTIRFGGGPDAFAIPGWSDMLGVAELVDDGTVAIYMAIWLFIIPSGSEKGGALMDWRTAERLPWGILLLFGGGFALAKGFDDSGLSMWIGGRLEFFAQYSQVTLIACTSLTVTFLTELTSNTATTNIILPIIGGVTKSIGVHPLLLMIPATLSASFAFMLPVATPPNAVVFASGLVPIRKMVFAGIVFNFIGVALTTLCMLYLIRPVFGF